MCQELSLLRVRDERHPGVDTHGLVAHLNRLLLPGQPADHADLFAVVKHGRLDAMERTAARLGEQRFIADHLGPLPCLREHGIRLAALVGRADVNSDDATHCAA
jgi:hypothetical protein